MLVFFNHPTRQTVRLSDLAVDIIKEALEEAGEEAALVFPSKSDAALEVEAGTLCIGGNSMAVFASSSTFCCTKTYRQNSNLNQSKYCCAPSYKEFPPSGSRVHAVFGNGGMAALVDKKPEEIKKN